MRTRGESPRKTLSLVSPHPTLPRTEHRRIDVVFPRSACAAVTGPSSPTDFVAHRVPPGCDAGGPFTDHWRQARPVRARSSGKWTSSTLATRWAARSMNDTSVRPIAACVSPSVFDDVAGGQTQTTRTAMERTSRTHIARRKRQAPSRPDGGKDKGPGRRARSSALRRNAVGARPPNTAERSRERTPPDPPRDFSDRLDGSVICLYSGVHGR